MNRRKFLQTSTAGIAGAALTMTFASPLFSKGKIEDWDPARPYNGIGKTLTVQPVLMYSISQPQKQRSWRPWGGLHNEQIVSEEVQRIGGELANIKKNGGIPTRDNAVEKSPFP